MYHNNKLIKIYAFDIKIKFRRHVDEKYKWQHLTTKPNRYLAVLNPRAIVPARYESRLSVAKSLAIYFNTL